MTPRAAIKKGKRGESEVCRRIELAGLGKARRESGSGNGLNKGDIFSNLPFLLEVKNQKTIKFQDWTRQAKEQARIGHLDPNKWGLVIISPDGVQEGDRMDISVTIEFDEFLNLLKRFSEPKIKEPDRELKYKLESLKESCRRLENNQEDKWEIKNLKRKCSEVLKILKN